MSEQVWGYIFVGGGIVFVLLCVVAAIGIAAELSESPREWAARVRKEDSEK